MCVRNLAGAVDHERPGYGKCPLAAGISFLETDAGALQYVFRSAIRGQFTQTNGSRRLGERRVAGLVAASQRQLGVMSVGAIRRWRPADVRFRQRPDLG